MRNQVSTPVRAGMSAPVRARGNRPSVALLLGAAAIALAVLAVFFAWPVTNMVAKGFIADGALDLSGFAEVFSSRRTWRIIGYTLANGILGTAFAVALAIPGAYVLYRCSFPGRGFLRAAVAVPFVLPTVAVGVARLHAEAEASQAGGETVALLLEVF